MDNNGLSVSDVAALSGGGFGGFGGGFEGLIYLAVIASMFGGGWGGFGFGGNAGAAMAGNLATQNDIQRGFDAQNSASNQREILAAVTAGTAQSVAATNQSFHDVLGIVQDKYGELQRDIAGLAVGQAQQIAAQGECCCSTKMLIAPRSATRSASCSSRRRPQVCSGSRISGATARARSRRSSAAPAALTSDAAPARHKQPDGRAQSLPVSF